MNTKFNEATFNRPEGDRIIDAPFVFIDIENYAKQLTEEEAWKKNDRNGITVFKSERQTLVLSVFRAGASLPENNVKGTVTIQVIQGFIKINLGGKDIELRKGNIAALHAGAKHSLAAADYSLVLITTNLAE